jgi:glycosyltransferase involved in cell wall biosynthesis
MKLLMTADTVGGVWTYCMELCAALAPYEVEIDLATMGRELSPEQRRQVGRLPHVTVHESAYRLCWMQDSADDVERAGEWLLSLERDVQPDVIQLNDLAHGGLDWQSPVVLVVHSCVFSWWQAVMGCPPPMDEWGDYHALVKQSVQRADLVLAPTHAMLEQVTHHYGAAKLSSVVYNGRDFPPLAPDFDTTDSQEKRQQAAFPSSSQVAMSEDSASAEGEEEVFIFAAGRIWDQAKNIGVLSPIVNDLPCPVYAAGEQADPNGGENIPEGLNCLGFLNSDEMAQWLKRAAIYVAPAHYEPFGLSALEAARAGCVLVLGAIDSLREVWGDAAVYVDPDDTEQLKQVLTDLANDSDMRRVYAKRAWQRSTRFTASRMAASYMQWYGYVITHTNERKQEGKPLSGARA